MGNPRVYVHDGSEMWVGTLVHVNPLGQPVVTRDGTAAERHVLEWSGEERYVDIVVCEGCGMHVKSMEAAPNEQELWLCSVCDGRHRTRLRATRE